MFATRKVGTATHLLDATQKEMGRQNLLLWMSPKQESELLAWRDAVN